MNVQVGARARVHTFSNEIYTLYIYAIHKYQKAKNKNKNDFHILFFFLPVFCVVPFQMVSIWCDGACVGVDVCNDNWCVCR